MKTKIFKSGAWTVFERLTPSGLYCVKLYGPAGDLRDKVRCDDRRMASEYWRAFNAIARGL